MNEYKTGSTSTPTYGTMPNAPRPRKTRYLSSAQRRQISGNVRRNLFPDTQSGMLNETRYWIEPRSTITD